MQWREMMLNRVWKGVLLGVGCLFLGGGVVGAKKLTQQVKIVPKGQHVLIEARVPKKQLQIVGKRGMKTVLRVYRHDGRKWARFHALDLRKQLWKKKFSKKRVCRGVKSFAVLQTAISQYHLRKKRWWNTKVKKLQKAFVPTYFQTTRIVCQAPRVKAKAQKKMRTRRAIRRPKVGAFGRVGMAKSAPSKAGFAAAKAGRVTNAWRGTQSFLQIHGHAWGPAKKGRVTNPWRKAHKRGRVTNPWRKKRTSKGNGRVTNPW
tara:strand:- start:18250 stop:19029 length:780 start_codon:yes stop_codon:yes gene_type:complete